MFLMLLYGINSDKDDDVIIINSNKDDNCKKSRYSSIQCTGGIQNIHCTQFFKPYQLFPHAHTKRVRTCKMQNVCYINGVVTFYAGNDSITRNLYNPSTLPNNGLLSSRNINVVYTEVPKDIPYSPYSYSFLYASDKGFNFVSKIPNSNYYLIIINNIIRDTFL